jgi:hypothetical protein
LQQIASVKTIDVTDTVQRPKGWQEVKLRRVYIKEWQDRKNGVDEDVIIERRYARELEVNLIHEDEYIFVCLLVFLLFFCLQAEKEMIQELSVRGRVRAYETAIKQQQQPFHTKLGTKQNRRVNRSFFLPLNVLVVS